MALKYGRYFVTRPVANECYKYDTDSEEQQILLPWSRSEMFISKELGAAANVALIAKSSSAMEATPGIEPA